MARDMAKKAVSDLRSQQKHYKQLTMKIRRDSGVFDALEARAAATGEATATFAQRVLREALIRDGYLSPQEDTDTPEE